MQHQRRRRSKAQKLVLFAIVAVTFVGGYYWGQLHAPDVSGYLNLSTLETPVAMPAFELQDHLNRPVGAQLFRDHWDLLLFGYSRDDGTSRDLLLLTTQVVNRLADNPALQRMTRAVLVSLDPMHDRPAILAPIIEHYSPDFLALTGESDQIQRLARRLGIKYKHLDQANGDRIDHSTNILLVDPQANLVGVFAGIVDAASIASDIKKISNER